MKIHCAIGASLLLFVPFWASAACTTDEAAAKSKELAAKVQEVTERNPDKAKEINEQMRAQDLESQTKGTEDECAIYDKRLRELDEADKTTKEETNDRLKP